jgi:hypothetical protein
MPRLFYIFPDSKGRWESAEETMGPDQVFVHQQPTKVAL